MGTRRTRDVGFFLAIALLLITSAVQGAPNASMVAATPGPFAQLLEAIAEAEPRIAVNVTNTPGDADSVFTIIEPGSYYLTGNVVGEPGKHGVKIVASGVSLDLRGFALIGVASSLDGIHVVPVAPNGGFLRTMLSVHNGSAQFWGGSGVSFEGASVSQLRDIRAWNNAGDGIRLGAQSQTIRCESSQNGSRGIAGVYTGNVVKECISHNNAGAGIDVFRASRVEGCSCLNNAGDGIVTRGDCLVSENLCDANGYFGNGSGIHVLAEGGTRIQRNNVTNNDKGIMVDSTANLIVGNSASGNETNYEIADGNSYGPIVNVAGMGDISADAAASHPWANMDF